MKISDKSFEPKSSGKLDRRADRFAEKLHSQKLITPRVTSQPLPPPEKAKKTFGTDANDYLEGQDDVSDYIYGLLGDDTLLGKGGNDQLEGGDGNDTLHGGLGDDLLIGDDSTHRGNDTISGDEGNDSIFCGGVIENGTDRVSLGSGQDGVHFAQYSNIRVDDFNPAEDRILMEIPASSYSGMITASETVDPETKKTSTLLQFRNSQPLFPGKILLVGVALDQFTAQNTIEFAPEPKYKGLT